jgi:hypothetical protein
MTLEQQAQRSKSIIDSFKGENPGEVISVLAATLQMAICLSARSKADAIDMASCITLDIEDMIPKQYDQHFSEEQRNGR